MHKNHIAEAVKLTNSWEVRISIVTLSIVGLLGSGGPAWASTYRVGPEQEYRQLSDLPTLAAGDRVKVDGDATYDSVVFDANGTAGNKIYIQGVKKNGSYPEIVGGTNTVHFRGDHYVFNNFSVTGGRSRCVFHEADDITIKNSVIHDCPAHGLLGADRGSGSLTLLYSEFYGSGDGAYKHQIYMATDEQAHPGSVFKMKYCYVHDSAGGHNVKSRAERNEIMYNWIEGAQYHELELIGPDGEPDGTAREDSLVIGNVLRKTGDNADFTAVRLGGDGTGQTWGRYRFLNNTFLLDGGSGSVLAFRFHFGLEAVEMFSNVFVRQGGNGTIRIYNDDEAQWDRGPILAGSHNWVQTGATHVPDEWSETLSGASPGFEDMAGLDLTPSATSPLRGRGLWNPATNAAAPFPTPKKGPTYNANRGGVMRPKHREKRQKSPLDIGAFGLAAEMNNLRSSLHDGEGIGEENSGTGPGVDAAWAGRGCSVPGGHGLSPLHFLFAFASLFRRKRNRTRVPV